MKCPLCLTRHSPKDPRDHNGLLRVIYLKSGECQECQATLARLDDARPTMVMAGVTFRAAPNGELRSWPDRGRPWEVRQ